MARRPNLIRFFKGLDGGVIDVESVAASRLVTVIASVGDEFMAVRLEPAVAARLGLDLIVAADVAADGRPYDGAVTES